MVRDWTHKKERFFIILQWKYRSNMSGWYRLYNFTGSHK